jgi:hypothetical protein
MVAPSALLVMPNPALARKTTQVLQCGGVDAAAIASASELATALNRSGRVSMICVPHSELKTAVAACHGMSDVRLFVYVDDADPDLFAPTVSEHRVSGVFGLRYPGGPPRPWELISVARRVSGGGVPPPYAPLAWGHEWHERTLGTAEERDATVEAIRAFSSRFQSTRHAQNISQLADELIMNAMYDAPVDAHSRPRYAHRRKEAIRLEPSERPRLGYGSDGARIVISVADPFGRLSRDAVFRGLHRGLREGTIDSSGGGAGLGMTMIYQTAKIVFFDVVPGRITQVTAVTELDVPARQHRRLPGSVHFFVH